MSETPTAPPRETRILMTGSRDWTDESIARDALNASLAFLGASPAHTVLVHGAAAGADVILAQVAMGAGMRHEAHPADWRTHDTRCSAQDRQGGTCRRAGHRRNEEMIAAGADICLAFPTHGYHLAPGEDRTRTSRGTWSCAEKAKAAGIPTLVVWGRSLYPFGEPATLLVARHAAARGVTPGADGAIPIIDAWLPF